LLYAPCVSTLTLRGGTHVQWSPPFDDLASTYFPMLRRLGYRVDAELVRWARYPVGGGEVTCKITSPETPNGPWQATPIEALAPGSLADQLLLPRRSRPALSDSHRPSTVIS
jgi:RNA 3'-terminal phosphate cyclase